ETDHQENDPPIDPEHALRKTHALSYFHLPMNCGCAERESSYAQRKDPTFLFLPPAQIGPFHAEDDLERQRYRAKADTDQNSPAYRGIKNIKNPRGHVAAQRNQILA